MTTMTTTFMMALRYNNDLTNILELAKIPLDLWGPFQYDILCLCVCY